jgi:hypothetical protein
MMAGGDRLETCRSNAPGSRPSLSCESTPLRRLWFEEPHEVVLLEPDGSRRTESAHLAGHTLIWLDDVTTLRLEGDLSLECAVEIAESCVTVD